MGRVDCEWESEMLGDTPDDSTSDPLSPAGETGLHRLGDAAFEQLLGSSLRTENGNDPDCPGSSLRGYCPAIVHPHEGLTRAMLRGPLPSLRILKECTRSGPIQISPKSKMGLSQMIFGALASSSMRLGAGACVTFRSCGLGRFAFLGVGSPNDRGAVNVSANAAAKNVAV